MNILSKHLLSIALGISALAALCPLKADNLVTNGDFSQFNGDSPKGWQKPSNVGAELVYDTTDKPDGVAGSLKITCTEANSGQGQIIQKFKIPSDGAYYLSGYLNTDNTTKGFIQIKLYKGGKEFQRISVNKKGDGWQKAGKEFEVMGAEQMAILLRYSQNKGNIGKTLGFADISVVPAKERVREAPAIAKLEAEPTFNSIGVYADISGDMSKFTNGHMLYRKKGSADWKPTLGVVWHDQTKQLRGSLLNLQEDTEYEVQVWMTDENIDQEMASATTSARTWKSEVPIGKTIHLGPGKITEPITITEKGTADAWILYTGSPEGYTEISVGDAANNAITIVDSEFVILENLTIKGGKSDAIKVSDSADIRIRRCDISNWGNPGTLLPSTNKKWGKGPFFLDDEGNRINLQAGVRINPRAIRVVVEDCFIHAPNGRATSWANGHPLGPTSIIMANSDGHHVIRNNDLVGGEEHRFNDTIEGAYNNKIKGGPYRDTDVQGNIMFFSNDDAIELDGGQMNVRMFNNWIASSYCGISTAPTLYGPSYLYRNLIVLEGEEREATNFAFKIGGNKSGEPGINYIFHNTVFSNGKGLRAGNWGRGPTPVLTRNNIFAQGEILYPQKSLGDFDYDMLRPNSMDPPLEMWQKNGVVGIPEFQDRAASDYRLPANSAAINKGLPLPMVNDDFTGSAPDLGAFPIGSDAVFPVRPNSVSLLPMSATIEMVEGQGPTKSATLTVQAPASLGDKWRVITDASWIKVSPQTGLCDGKPHEITLSFAPQSDIKGKQQAGVTVRTDAGYNRTSFITGIAKPKDTFLVGANAVDLEYAGFIPIEQEGAPVAKVLQAPASRADSAKAYIKFPVSIPKDGIYYLHALTYIPGPGAPGRDSLRLQIDDGEIEYWSLGKSAPSVWLWQMANIHKKQYPLQINLTAGEHLITVWGRESQTEVAKLALSNSTLPPVEETPKISMNDAKNKR